MGVSIPYFLWTFYQSRFGSKIDLNETDALKRWAQNAYCIYTGDFDYALMPHDTVKPLLIDSWNILSKTDLMRVLDDLARAESPYPAWDLIRHINLARMGVKVKYLTDAESWQLIKPICQQLQSRYSSWEEIGEDYLRGRRAWLNLDINGSQDKTDKEMPRINANITRLRQTLWATTPYESAF